MKTESTSKYLACIPIMNIISGDRISLSQTLCLTVFYGVERKEFGTRNVTKVM